MSLVYLAVLLCALGMLIAVDARLRLVFWRRPAVGGLVMAMGVTLFLAWDIAAIHLGHYGRGPAPQSGVLLAADLPLEELFFVVFLLYLALILHALARRTVRPRHGPGRDRAGGDIGADSPRRTRPAVKR